MKRKKEIDFSVPSYFPVRINLTGYCASASVYSLPFKGDRGIKGRIEKSASKEELIKIIKDNWRKLN